MKTYLSTYRGMDRIRIDNSISNRPENMIILNYDILLPALIPRNDRDSFSFNHYPDRLGQDRGYANDSKRKEIVNIIEDGTFRKMRGSIATTDDVLERLKRYDRKQIEKWEGNVENTLLTISLSPGDFRYKYKETSNDFPGDSDFSVAASSLTLGAAIATEHPSFNFSSLRNLKKEFFEKWRISKRFEKIDSATLLKRLV
jgi:hypothetical protein